MTSRVFLILATLLLAFTSLAGVSCSQLPTGSGEGFAIYLTRNNIPPEKMEMQSQVEMMDEPVISVDDILSYNARTHEIKLTDAAFERVSKLSVPVRGKSFLVCVDGTPVYWGAFWAPFSSMSFNGVAILIPLGSQGSGIMTIGLGYPSASFYKGEDPRGNPIILDSLENSGKLINKITVTDANQLPRSFKGYELYSWEKDGQWHFTLIVGTNRNKTLEEIISETDAVSETGWMKTHVVGVEALKSVLGRLPEGEYVFWSDGTHIWPENANLTLPPVGITQAIAEYAGQHSLNFSITAQSPALKIPGA